jgi:hypothetical protein
MKYEHIYRKQAEAEGLASDFGWNTSGLIVLRKDDGTSEIIGWDGGEPEDQLLSRDWRWVVGALNKALELGASSDEGPELQVISAVNTYPLAADLEKQVKLFTEWAHRCVNQAHWEGRDYVEAVCRMSPKPAASPSGQCIQSALRHNPGQSDSAPDEQADDGQGEQHDGGS